MFSEKVILNSYYDWLKMVSKNMLVINDDDGGDEMLMFNNHSVKTIK